MTKRSVLEDRLPKTVPNNNIAGKKKQTSLPGIWYYPPRFIFRNRLNGIYKIKNQSF